jgi:cytochrome c oxidase subunit II
MISTSARILAVAVIVSVLSMSTGASPATQAVTPRVIEIVAERFEFWPSEITVAEGEQVEFRIRSDDTMHGFRIVGAGTNVLIPKRGKGQVVARFTATTPGRYTFECSRMCGAGHNFMRGVLLVRPASARTQP